MKPKKFFPTLMVEDMSRSIEYYETVLNFKLVKTNPDREPFDWAWLERDMLGIALQPRALMAFDIPEMQDLKAGSTIVFHLDVDDVEAVYAQMKDRVEISQDIFTFHPNVREFRIRDLNGYFWTFTGEVDQ
jgi:uncharacterized glyoxalase superfamily protein PhnB